MYINIYTKTTLLQVLLFIKISRARPRHVKSCQDIADTCCAVYSITALSCGVSFACQQVFDVFSSLADETVTLSAVLERLNPHLAQIKVLHKVFCTGVAEVPPETPNVVRASHLLNTLYKAIIEYDSAGEASEQAVSLSVKLVTPCEFNKKA